MLDKSVPYAGLFMCRKAGAPVPDYPLPKGYKFAYYKDGDELCWAKIETSVLEFDSEFAALLFYKDYFMPEKDELCRRCLFIENSDGVKIATATAWWSDVEGERRPWLHWVSVDPAYQGMGLGKAISARVTRLLIELNGDVPIYIKTQTWSYKAINIYITCGYEPTDEKKLYKERTDNYKKAKKILKNLLRPELPG